MGDIASALSNAWAGVAEFFSDIWHSLQKTIAILLFIIAICFFILGLLSGMGWISTPASAKIWYLAAAIYLCGSYAIDPNVLRDAMGILSATVGTVISGSASIITTTLTGLVDPDGDGKIFGIPLAVVALGTILLIMRD